MGGGASAAESAKPVKLTKKPSVSASLISRKKETYSSQIKSTNSSSLTNPTMSRSKFASSKPNSTPLTIRQRYWKRLTSSWKCSCGGTRAGVSWLGDDRVLLDGVGWDGGLRSDDWLSATGNCAQELQVHHQPGRRIPRNEECGRNYRYKREGQWRQHRRAQAWWS